MVTRLDDDDRLNTELADAFGELIDQVVERFEDVGRRFSLPAFCVKALHMLSSPMAMKELGQKFHCDPSFVTSIADMLDARGLGRRETDTKDRRIKNLMLTDKGRELRACLEREIAGSMPWTGSLDPSERECLLGLIRKMVKAEEERKARAGSAAGVSKKRNADTGKQPADTGRRTADQGVTQAPSSAANSGR
jgi:DNA-binding MarR family transcriptional regulator